MRAELGLPSVKGDDEHGGGMTGGFGGSMGGAGQGGKGKRPISVKFEIPYFTTSGIQVRYLKIIEPKVSPIAIRALLPICTLLLMRFFTPREAIGYAFVLHTAGAPHGIFPAVARILQLLSSVRAVGPQDLASHEGRHGAMARRSVRGCFDFVLVCAVTLTHIAR